MALVGDNTVKKAARVLILEEWTLRDGHFGATKKS